MTTHQIDTALRRLEPAEVDALATDPASMAKLLGIGLSTLDRMFKRGEIPGFKLGARTLYSVDAVRQWLTAKANANLSNEASRKA